MGTSLRGAGLTLGERMANLELQNFILTIRNFYARFSAHHSASAQTFNEERLDVAAGEETSHILSGLTSQLPDRDPEETAEWVESLDALIREQGTERAQFIMRSLLQRAGSQSVGVPMVTTTDYVNTIPADQEAEFPGNEEFERRYRAYMRWNAAVMVHRAQRADIGVGGHISTYAGAATLYEVGFNHFFRGKDHPSGGDQVFFQGHASPGMYARAFMEGRLSEEDLDGFRQEKSKQGHALSSYPHPRLMPSFWEFPTVSMGIGPMNAIYQAQSNRYLHDRGLKDTSDQQVWAFLGDGEMDEPESRGLLQLAANENLDNLNFVINCNLQRLDGPVRGNGKIMQELEAFFRGAGWNVIKVVWGREWDDLLARDTDGSLVKIMNETVDGDYQTYKAESGGFVREHFFGKTPATKDMVADLDDNQIWNLKRGGHDYRKVYAAYKAAVEFKGKPTVILAKTVKGYGLGPHFEGRNATHQMKKLTLADLKEFRDYLRIPISDDRLEEDPYRPPYYHPGMDAPEIAYLLERRAALGGSVPERRSNHAAIELPEAKTFDVAKRGYRQTAGRHHHGLRPSAQRPAPRQEVRAPDCPHRPGRVADLRNGRVLPDREDLQPQGPELPLRGPGPRPGLQGIPHGPAHPPRHQRSRRRRGLHRRGHRLRHPRRTPRADLRVLLHVRLPTHRRRVLGRRGPNDPRLHHRRHRRTDHPHRRRTPTRRRTLPHPGLHQPRRPHLRPRLRLRNRTHHPRRPRTHVRRELRRPERDVLPHRVQRTDQPARGTGEPRRQRRPQRHLPAQPRRKPTGPARSSWPPASRSPGPWKPRKSSPRTGASPPTSGP